MKRLTVILMGLLLASSAFANKKAILIGVSNYPVESGWRKLSSHNDLELIKSVLAHEWEISLLEDKNATHSGIVSILSKISETASLGDTVLIHFSGHGQQMIPIVSDVSNEPDMLDEALIPYDAQFKWSTEYTGQNHLRDDEFSKIIDKIRDRVGVKGLVIVIIDACHSDSMQRVSKEDGKETKTTTIYRGTEEIFGKEVTRQDINNRYNRDTSIIRIDNNSEVVYISACQAHSQNQEIKGQDKKGYGSLSYSVANALRDGGIKDIKGFLDRVIVNMNILVPYQTPGIRASFIYSSPVLVQQTDSTVVECDKTKTSKGKYAVNVISIIILLSIIIWILKKK